MIDPDGSQVRVLPGANCQGRQSQQDEQGGRRLGNHHEFETFESHIRVEAHRVEREAFRQIPGRDAGQHEADPRSGRAEHHPCQEQIGPGQSNWEREAREPISVGGSDGCPRRARRRGTCDLEEPRIEHDVESPAQDGPVGGRPELEFDHFPDREHGCGVARMDRNDDRRVGGRRD